MKKTKEKSKMSVSEVIGWSIVIVVLIAVFLLAVDVEKEKSCFEKKAQSYCHSKNWEYHNLDYNGKDFQCKYMTTLGLLRGEEFLFTEADINTCQAEGVIG